MKKNVKNWRKKTGRIRKIWENIVKIWKKMQKVWKKLVKIQKIGKIGKSWENLKTLGKFKKLEKFRKVGKFTKKIVKFCIWDNKKRCINLSKNWKNVKEKYWINWKNRQKNLEKFHIWKI